MAKQVRQGHILLTPRPIPDAARHLKTVDSHVLATGETGREHLLRSDNLDIYQHGPSLFIHVKGAGGILVHEEHGEVPLEPGEYEYIEQREFDDTTGFGTRRSHD